MTARGRQLRFARPASGRSDGLKPQGLGRIPPVEYRVKLLPNLYF
jgi:hypothetical protein